MVPKKPKIAVFKFASCDGCQLSLLDAEDELLLVAGAVAVVSAIVGLYLSYYLNVASGASIVLVETSLFGAALVVSPRHGLLARRRSRPAGAPG